MALIGLLAPYQTQAGQAQIVFNIDYDLHSKIESQLLTEYQQQQAELREQVLAKARVAAKSSANKCSCVLFAKATTGYNRPVGAAKNWPINTNIPRIGEVVVTKESWTGHVIVITDVREGEIDVVEGNYRRCQATQRTIKLDNKLIKGFWQST